jgi:A/G-specific adenine glycosylase
LLRWYGEHARALPWRVPPRERGGAHPDPYQVWLSEIMLQQTVVKTVIPYFERFLQTWPSVFDLAADDLEEVLKRWAGLGYYARGRNLHACAKMIVQDHRGRFPQDEKALLALPGIGPYTAAAIRAIGFDLPATVVDGNVERVVARLFAHKQPVPETKPRLKQLANDLTPQKRPGDYAQAMMDLGATVCTPKRPSCSRCPLVEDCVAYREGCADALPARAPKKPKPVRFGTAFLVLRQDGSVLLRQRPDKGLLAKMLEVPSTPWIEKSASDKAVVDGQSHFPVAARWGRVPGLVTHTFTHFHLEIAVDIAMVATSCSLLPQADPARCRWVARRDLADQALPGVMRKIISHGLGEPL